MNPLRSLPLLLTIGIAAGDVVEDFDGGWSDPSYGGVSSYDHVGVGIWESNDSLVAGDKSRSGDYVRLGYGGSYAPYLEFKGLDGNGVDGGVGTVTFWFRHWDGDGSSIPFALESNIGGAGWTEAATGTATTTTYQQFSATLDLAGDDIRLRIRPTGSPPAERLLIDDFAITTSAPTPVIGFDQATSTAGEADGTVQIPVTLSIPGSATVDVSVSGGDAATPGDFQLLTTSLTFTTGNPTQNVSVSLTDDSAVESAETIELTLSNPSGASLGSSTHTLTLVDNDSAPSSGETLVIVSANTTSGNLQEYEGPGDRIFQALDPDIIGIQEFSVPDAGGHRAWVDRVFGTDFHYFVEPGGENIPCGVVSRYPITASGEWDDPQVSDRDFAWASIDIPGDKDLHIVSVHLHGSGGSSSRNTEAGVIVSQVQATFPASDYIVLTGDLNTTSRNEACITTFKTVFSDARMPVDQSGDDDTNEPRNNPYDWVMPNAELETLHTTFEIGGQSFPDGLVFDTRLWSPPPAPALAGDSGVSGMQHMAVVKAYQLPGTPAPAVTTRGTPHSWLESFGFGGDFEAADLLDPDHDGYANWQEYLAGTGPTDSTSFFDIDEVSLSGGIADIMVPTQPGRSYTIEFADAADSGASLGWSPFADPSLGTYLESSATPATHTFHDDQSPLTTGGPPAAGRRYYRVAIDIP